MKTSADGTRRALLLSTGAAAACFAATACGSSPVQAQATPESPQREREEGVSANEDLMREHGVLDRLLLIYETGLARIKQEPAIAASLHRSADLISRFIEQYHEKLEEDFIFPLLERAQRHTDVVRVLRAQHVAGRELTQTILRLTSEGALPPGDGEALSHAIRGFIRMYRPHAAREDTVVFPALHQIVSPKELRELGERFEDVEHERFGEQGFDSVVHQVEEIENGVGIYDLAQFTPQVGPPHG